MAYCGECDNFGKCTHRKENDEVNECSMFYPNIYMETNHPKEWKEYTDKLNCMKNN